MRSRISRSSCLYHNSFFNALSDELKPDDDAPSVTFEEGLLKNLPVAFVMLNTAFSSGSWCNSHSIFFSFI
jgi:hypothetical protein